MKLFVLICLLTIAYCQNNNKISSRLDNLDIDSVLSTGRILENYLKCILDRGPCTVEGRELKNAIPRALLYGCKDCSEPTKKIVKKASIYMIKNKPELWETLRKHYDPDGTYREEFYKFLGI